MIGPLARWVHLTACIMLVGTSAVIFIAGRSGVPMAEAWQARMLRWSRWLMLAAIIGGLGTLGHQATVFEGRLGAAVDPQALCRLLFQTQAGIAWLARHGVLLLLAAFLACRLDATRRVDWLAARVQVLALAAAALGLLAASGHAAAVEPGSARAITADVLHLLAAGIWAGGLPAVGALLGAVTRDGGERERAYAVRATRVFSRVALGGVLVLLVSGTVITVIHVGNVGALLGTGYGRLLLLKLALVGAVLALAAFNRRRLLPAIVIADTATPALRLLRRFVIAEGALLLAVLAIVALMGLTPPARHQSATWLLPIRLEWTPVSWPFGTTIQVMLARVVVIGLLGALVWRLVRRRQRMVAVGGAAFTAAAVAIVLPRMSIDAYPTTYVRPTVAYTAASISSGARVYADHCAACHGASDAISGSAVSTSLRGPLDLRSDHVARHTAGDLYWWITHGISSRMPAFGQRLTEERRWDVVNFVRARRAAEDARQLGPRVEVGRRWLVAPDFAFAVGPSLQTLRDYRGDRIVLLVLYSLPGSRARISDLALGSDALDLQRVEVIAVPTDADPDAIRHFGPVPRLLFPIVTGGAADIVTVYRMFAGAVSHAEFLIDRQGYLRAWWTLAAGTTRPIEDLLAEVQTLWKETGGPPAEEHVH